MILQCTQNILSVNAERYHSASAESERGQDKQEYASVLTACFPHTKLLHLHLMHLCSHFLSSLRGHEWYRQRFFAGFIAHRRGAGCTSIVVQYICIYTVVVYNIVYYSKLYYSIVCACIV